VRERKLWEGWRADNSVSRLDFEGVDSGGGIARARASNPNVVRAGRTADKM